MKAFLDGMHAVGGKPLAFFQLPEPIQMLVKTLVLSLTILNGLLLNWLTPPQTDGAAENANTQDASGPDAGAATGTTSGAETNATSGDLGTAPADGMGDVQPGGIDPAAGGGAPPGGETNFLVEFFGNPLNLILISGILFIMLVLRPQQKQMKELQKKLAGLKKNDRVITGSGIHGVVVQAAADEPVVTLRIDDNTGARITVNRDAITKIVSNDNSKDSKN